MNDTATEVIAVIDDEASVRNSIARLLRASGYRTRTFASATRFLEDADDLSPNCVIADLTMPGLSGLDLQQTLIERNAVYPLIIVTGFGDLRSGVMAMRKGAVDFLPKPFEKGELLQAVSRAIDRDRGHRQAIDNFREVAEKLAALTSRERDVFDRVVAGLMNKQIGAELDITEKTVKVHRARVMRKMGVRSVAQLARIAERLDIRSPH